MIGLFVDLLYVFFGGLAGLATVRLTGMALNRRDRKRHARCLKNIERLEVANGYREAKTLSQVFRDFGPGQVFELKPGAEPPRFIQGPQPSFAALVAQQMAARGHHKSALANLLHDMETAREREQKRATWGESFYG